MHIMVARLPASRLQIVTAAIASPTNPDLYSNPRPDPADSGPTVIRDSYCKVHYVLYSPYRLLLT